LDNSEEQVNFKEVMATDLIDQISIPK